MAKDSSLTHLSVTTFIWLTGLQSLNGKLRRQSENLYSLDHDRGLLGDLEYSATKLSIRITVIRNK